MSQESSDEDLKNNLLKSKSELGFALDAAVSSTYWPFNFSIHSTQSNQRVAVKLDEERSSGEHVVQAYQTVSICDKFVSIFNKLSALRLLS